MFKLLGFCFQVSKLIENRIWGECFISRLKWDVSRLNWDLLVYTVHRSHWWKCFCTQAGWRIVTITLNVCAYCVCSYGWVRLFRVSSQIWVIYRHGIIIEWSELWRKLLEKYSPIAWVRILDIFLKGRKSEDAWNSLGPKPTSNVST